MLVLVLVLDSQRAGKERQVVLNLERNVRLVAAEQTVTAMVGGRQRIRAEVRGRLELAPDPLLEQRLGRRSARPGAAPTPAVLAARVQKVQPGHSREQPTDGIALAPPRLGVLVIVKGDAAINGAGEAE